MVGGVKRTQKSGRRAPSPNDHDEGAVRFSFPATGTKRVDLLLLGLALYKIAWGLVAHDAGPEAALQQQGQDLADPQQVDGSDVAD